MAERRMFAKTIIDSDAFLDMGLSAQALYFHLCMRADDEGFINNPRKIQRMIGAGDDDLRLLAAKRFIIPFDSGVVVVKHWRIHNYIRGDRFKPTVYVEEREQLDTKENGAYTCLPNDNQMDTKCVPTDNHPTTNRVPNDYQMDTQVRLGKDRLGKDRLGKDTICAEPLLAASVPHEITVNAVKAATRSFERFWEAYPKKVGKKAAGNAFMRVLVDTDTLIDAIEKQKRSEQWTKENGRYIPNPATWLNQGRWEDELPAARGDGYQKHDQDLRPAMADWIRRSYEQEDANER